MKSLETKNGPISVDRPKLPPLRPRNFWAKWNTKQEPGPLSTTALHLVRRFAPGPMPAPDNDDAKVRAIADYNRRRGWLREV